MNSEDFCKTGDNSYNSSLLIDVPQYPIARDESTDRWWYHDDNDNIENKTIHLQSKKLPKDYKQLTPKKSA